MKTLLLLLLLSFSLFAEDVKVEINPEVQSKVIKVENSSEVEKLKAEIATLKKERKVLEEIKSLRKEIQALKKKKNKKRDNRFGLGLNLAGPTMLEGPVNLSFDYFINKDLNLVFNFALSSVQTGEQGFITEEI